VLAVVADLVAAELVGVVTEHAPLDIDAPLVAVAARWSPSSPRCRCGGR
jgi:hypothetical protein